MKVLFKNLSPRLAGGMADFLALHRIENADGGMEIKLSSASDGALSIIKNGAQVTFCLPAEHRVFRALTLLKELAEEENAVYREPCCFEHAAVMMDGSQKNSLLTVSSLKEMLLYLCGMGYNQFMLYCEDCYEIKGEPYFGNMRPRYTQAELRELDDYADSLGIELIPAIQTLGHLTEAIKRPPYAKMADTKSVLMVGDDAVYRLIDRILSQLSVCFRSKKIHLGLDEAWDLGLGNYLRTNGYRPQNEIMREHLSRITALSRRYGYEPMMWSDMYFRAKSGTGDYHDEAVLFNESDAADVPEGMGLVYWDYYSASEAHYKRMIEQHRMLSDRILFAGCARNTFTFGTHYRKTAMTTDAALSACKACGIKDVIATVWGDDQAESSPFAVLAELQLFAEHMYCDTVSEAHTAKRFSQCVMADYDAFAKGIDALDTVPDYNGENPGNGNVSRACMWQDILLGLMDADLRGYDFSSHYAALKADMQRYAAENPQFGDMFRFYAHTACVLETKASLGLRLTRAYQTGDRPALTAIRDQVLPKLKGDMTALHAAHRDYFLSICKPIGWEIMDIRYGGAILRIDTAVKRLDDYLSERIPRIEELEEERLSYNGNDRIGHALPYAMLCSASRLSQF